MTNEIQIRPKYRDKFQLMNKSELDLFNQLRAAAPNMLVFSQVSMSQVFHLNRFNKDDFRKLGEIGQKSIDFLICRPDSSIVLAVESNGPHHDTAKQKAGDERKRTALEQAGIPLIVFKPGEVPDLKELRRILATDIVERKRYETERDKRYQRSSP